MFRLWRYILGSKKVRQTDQPNFCDTGDSSADYAATSRSKRERGRSKSSLTSTFDMSSTSRNSRRSKRDKDDVPQRSGRRSSASRSTRLSESSVDESVRASKRQRSRESESTEEENKRQSVKRRTPQESKEPDKKRSKSNRAERDDEDLTNVDDKKDLEGVTVADEVSRDSIGEHNSSVGECEDTDDCRSTVSSHANENKALVEDSSDAAPGRSSRSRRSTGSSRKKRCRNVSSQSEDSSVESHQKIVQTRNGIDFKTGERLEAMDFQDKWYAAKIIEVDNEMNEILIHFERWNSRYDEWVPMDSPRLRPVAHPSTRRDVQQAKKTKTAVPGFQVGEAVLARWSDCKLYQAEIREILPDGYYEVIFYDGLQRKIHSMNIHKMTEGSNSKYSKMTALDSKTGGKLDSSSSTVSGKSEISVVAPKEFVIEEDHNRYKCPEKDCGKGFRKEVLMHSHIKHYHQSSPSPSTSRSRHGRDSESRSSIASDSPSRKEEERPLVSPVAECVSEPPVMSASVSEQPSSTPQEVIEQKKEEVAVVETVPLPTELKPKPSAPPMRILKKVYPVTKMETRHAKLCFFKEDFSYLKEAKYLKSSGHRGEAIGSAQKGYLGKQIVSTKKSSKFRDGESDERRASPKKSPMPKTVKIELAKDTFTDASGIASADTIQVKEEPQELKGVSPSGRDAADISHLPQRGEDPAPEDEVVRCICECNDENGLMIQCETCMTWQHGFCFGIEEVENVPEKYLCYVCSLPRGVRKSFRYKYDQDWLQKGELPTFGFLKAQHEEDTTGTPRAGQSEAILATHELTSSVHGIINVLHGLQHKLNVVRSDNSPELKYWAKPWTTGAASSLSKSGPAIEEENATKEDRHEASNGMNSECTAASHFTAFDHSYFSPKQESVCVTLVGNPPEVATETVISTASATLTNLSSDDEDDEMEGGVPNTVALDHGYAEEGSQEHVDVAVYKKNLTEHIHSVQVEMSNHLDSIEELLDFLEADAGSEGASEVDDFQEVMKSVQSLSQDLHTVQRFTRYR